MQERGPIRAHYRRVLGYMRWFLARLLIYYHAGLFQREVHQRFQYVVGRVQKAALVVPRCRRGGVRSQAINLGEVCLDVGCVIKLVLPFLCHRHLDLGQQAARLKSARRHGCVHE